MVQESGRTRTFHASENACVFNALHYDGFPMSVNRI